MSFNSVLRLIELEQFVKLGVTDQERGIPQRVTISLELKVDVFNAARYDSIADTLDYVELVELIRSISEAKTFRLAEAYGMYLLEAILTKWEIVTAGSISVVKSIFPGMKGFEVEIELQRGDLN